MKTAKVNPNGNSSSASDEPSAVREPGMPWEMLNGEDWRLPSGKALAEFALQSGFLAPFLFEAKPLEAKPLKREKTERAAEKPVRTVETKGCR